MSDKGGANVDGKFFVRKRGENYPGEYVIAVIYKSKPTVRCGRGPAPPHTDAVHSPLVLLTRSDLPPASRTLAPLGEEDWRQSHYRQRQRRRRLPHAASGAPLPQRCCFRRWLQLAHAAVSHLPVQAINHLRHARKFWPVPLKEHVPAAAAGAPQQAAPTPAPQAQQQPDAARQTEEAARRQREEAERQKREEELERKRREEQDAEERARREREEREKREREEREKREREEREEREKQEREEREKREREQPAKVGLGSMAPATVGSRTSSPLSRQ